MLATKNGYSSKEMKKLDEKSYAKLDEIEKKQQDEDSDGVEIEN